MDEDLAKDRVKKVGDAEQQGEHVASELAKPGRRVRFSLKEHRALLITMLALIIILTTSGIALGFYTWDWGTIAAGVEISGVSVSELPLPEATQKLQSMVQGILNQEIVFVIGDKQIKRDLNKLGLKLDFSEALDQAYKIGREGSIPTKALNKRNATKGLSLELKSSWDEKVLTEALKADLSGFNVLAKDASFTITANNAMEIKPEAVGSVIDIPALIAQIKAMDVKHPTQVKVTLRQDDPKITAAQLESQKVTGLVAAYSTRFDRSLLGRTENVRVAAKALDGTIINPDAIFSFNEVVGERTSAAGYKDALIILEGEFVPGLGGGICQVSSTLYNVLLLGDLPILERSNHTLPIAYVPLGRDATVAYPTLDLKFKNDTGAYLLIRTKISGDVLTFEMYGRARPDKEVTISTSTDSVLTAKEQRIVDKSLAGGTTHVKQTSAPGFLVSTSRTVKIGGKVVKQENLGKSRYEARPSIVLVGP